MITYLSEAGKLIYSIYKDPVKGKKEKKQYEENIGLHEVFLEVRGHPKDVRTHRTSTPTGRESWCQFQTIRKSPLETISMEGKSMPKICSNQQKPINGCLDIIEYFRQNTTRQPMTTSRYDIQGGKAKNFLAFFSKF